MATDHTARALGTGMAGSSAEHSGGTTGNTHACTPDGCMACMHCTAAHSTSHHPCDCYPSQLLHVSTFTLDTWPYGGFSTSQESFSLGTPVLTHAPLTVEAGQLPAMVGYVQPMARYRCGTVTPYSSPDIRNMYGQILRLISYVFAVVIVCEQDYKPKHCMAPCVKPFTTTVSSTIQRGGASSKT